MEDSIFSVERQIKIRRPARMFKRLNPGARNLYNAQCSLAEGETVVVGPAQGMGWNHGVYSAVPFYDDNEEFFLLTSEIDFVVVR